MVKLVHGSVKKITKKFKIESLIYKFTHTHIQLLTSYGINKFRKFFNEKDKILVITFKQFFFSMINIFEQCDIWDKNRNLNFYL